MDAYLRGPKESILAPVARWSPRGVHPNAITLVAVVPGIGAAVAAAAGVPAIAVSLWLLNRVLDGLDGTLARQRGRQSDLGGYLDILMDFVVYAAVPIGLAAHAGDRETWVGASVLLATFYVNTISWAYLSAVLERRARDVVSPAPGYTAVTMPGGLIEGAETVVIYTVMLAIPTWAPALFWVMTAAVMVTIGQRVVWAVHNL